MTLGISSSLDGALRQGHNMARFTANSFSAYIAAVTDLLLELLVAELIAARGGLASSLIVVSHRNSGNQSLITHFITLVPRYTV